ncbi:MAG: thiol reductant ABC exporter subunit CydC [Halofilum sp. (in: g-proteobacteria)]
MRELAPYVALLGARWGRIAAGLALMLATVLCAVGLLALAGWFITATAVTAALWSAGAGARLGIHLPGAGIRSFALGRTVSRYFERLYNHDTVLRLLSDLRTRVFARLARLDPATLAQLRPAEHLHRLTADVDALDNLYLRALAPPAIALLGIGALGALLAAFSPAIALTVTGLLLATTLAVTLIALAVGAPIGARVARRAEALRTRLIDTIAGLAELRTLGTLADQRARLDGLDRALTRDRQRLVRLSALGQSAVTLAVQLTAALALFMGIGLYQADAISGPVLALMPLAVIALGEALSSLPSAFVELGRTRAAARHLNEQSGACPRVREPAQPARTPRRDDMALQQVSLRHAPGGEPVLQHAALTIGEYETVAVVGPSGSGKSTVADLCARILDPDSGCVRLGGVDLRRLRFAQLHGRVSYLTQHTELFADTIAGNLRIARPEADDAALRHALSAACLEDVVAGLPDGLDTWVGESGVQLSAGQARRLALARVILRDAPVVILDEPLAHLDEDTATEVRRRLDSWLRHRTALLLGPRAGALPTAHRILRIADGRFARA